jgi:hypothetical protein
MLAELPRAMRPANVPKQSAKTGPTRTQTVSLYHVVENESPGGPAYEFVAFARFPASPGLCNATQLDTEVKKHHDLWAKATP